MKRKILILTPIVLIISIWLYHLSQPPKDKRDSSYLIFIPSQTNSDKLFKILKYQGIPLWQIDRVFLPSSIQKGWIRLDSKTSIYRLLKNINSYPREKTRKVVFYSGDTIEDFTKQLSKQINISQKELLSEYYKDSPFIEGGILAGFYRLPFNIKAEPAIKYLLYKSQNIFKKLSIRYRGYYKTEIFKRYLIIASIIQKETQKKEEMPLISAVIYNRLKKGMKLQLDATLNYGSYSHTPVTPQRIRKDTSYFNTYKYKGLPPIPLGSVTVDALKASFNPAKKSYLYFVREITGRHTFSSTYAQHLANIKRIKEEKERLKKYTQKQH